MSARNIALRYVDVLKANVRDEMERRGKNATGDTSRRIETITSGGDETGTASLEADSQWKYVGNGRGPGGRPPIGNLRRWIQARGLRISAFALANKIAKEGTRDFRLKRTNVFLDEIDAWEDRSVPMAEDEFAAFAEQKGLQTIDEVFN